MNLTKIIRRSGKCRVAMLSSLDEVVDKRWDIWPWDKNTLGGDLLFWIFCLKTKVTLAMKRAILFIKTTITWAAIRAFFSTRILVP